MIDDILPIDPTVSLFNIRKHLEHNSYLCNLVVKVLLRFTDDEVDEMYREAPIKNGMFDYTEFTRSCK